jgi:hypothetical protein
MSHQAFQDALQNTVENELEELDDQLKECAKKVCKDCSEEFSVNEPGCQALLLMCSACYSRIVNMLEEDGVPDQAQDESKNATTSDQLSNHAATPDQLSNHAATPDQLPEHPTDPKDASSEPALGQNDPVLAIDAVKGILLNIVGMRMADGKAEIHISGVMVTLLCLNWHETSRKIKLFACETPRSPKLYWYNALDAYVSPNSTLIAYMVFECGRVLCAVWESRY